VTNSITGLKRASALCAVTVLVTIATGGCHKAVGHRKAHKPQAVKSAKAFPETETDKYWKQAEAEVYKSALEILDQHRAELARGIRHHKLMHGDPRGKQVAITFDDGPHPDFTPKLLAILKQFNAKATFFVVGEMAEKNPALIKSEVAGGHNVGNHTYHHVNLTKIPNEYVATEIKACGDVIKSITGKAPHLFRPPGGDYNERVAEVAEALGYIIALWTDDPGDYASPGKRLIESRVLDNITGGSIVLIHDGVQQTVDVLPPILEHLERKGYECVTIDQMMAGKQPGR